MEAALTAHLLAWSALVAAVTTSDGVQINWDKLPERESVPALILHDLAFGGPLYTMRGRSRVEGRGVQFDCWAQTKAEAIALRGLLLPALDALFDRPLQVFVQRFHGSWDAGAAPDVNRSTDLYRASLDGQVWFTAA